MHDKFDLTVGALSPQTSGRLLLIVIFALVAQIASVVVVTLVGRVKPGVVLTRLLYHAYLKSCRKTSLYQLLLV